MRGRCSQCGRSLTRASAERVAAGLPRLGTRAKTCGRRECVNAQGERWRREWWAKVRHRKLEGRRIGEPWTCSECGCDLAAADRKRRRLALPAIGLTNVVCSPRCQVEREARRYVVRYGAPARRKRSK